MSQKLKIITRFFRCPLCSSKEIKGENTKRIKGLQLSLLIVLEQLIAAHCSSQGPNLTLHPDNMEQVNHHIVILQLNKGDTVELELKSAITSQDKKELKYKYQ